MISAQFPVTAEQINPSASSLATASFQSVQEAQAVAKRIPFSFFLKLATARMGHSGEKDLTEQVDILSEQQKEHFKASEARSKSLARSSSPVPTQKRKSVMEPTPVSLKEALSLERHDAQPTAPETTPFAGPIAASSKMETTFLNLARQAEQPSVPGETLMIDLSPTRLAQMLQEIKMPFPLKEVSLEQVIDEIVTKASWVTKNGETHFILQLTPKELGKISVTLIHSEQGITIHIVAWEGETRRMLAQQAGELKTQFSALKLVLKELSITEPDSTVANETTLQLEQNIAKMQRKFQLI